jgi:hypothetical protein
VTWLTWRQHRWEAASALTVLLVFGVGVLVLRSAGAGLMAEIARNCPQSQEAIVPSQCTSLIGQYTSSFQTLWWWVTVAGAVIPALVGVFVGVPLIAREAEHGTHRLIWTQGITRRRWFLSTIGLVALGVVAGSAALAIAGQGWFSMERGLGSLGNQSVWDGFEIGPPVLIAYALFALALGVASGAAIRRTVPAIAASLIGFLVARLAIALLARPAYLPPLTSRGSFGLSGFTSGQAASAWVVGPMTLSDGSGHPIPSGEFCQGPDPGCYAQVLTLQHYQPADRFWLFQSIEAAIFVAMALVLFALAYRLVMRMR